MVTTTIFDNTIWKSFIQPNTNTIISWKNMRTLHRLLLMSKLCHIQVTFFSSYLICFTDWWWSSCPSLHILEDKHFQSTHQYVTFLTLYNHLQFSQTTFIGRAGYSAIGFLTIWDKQDGLHHSIFNFFKLFSTGMMLYMVLVGWGVFLHKTKSGNFKTDKDWIWNQKETIKIEHIFRSLPLRTSC